MKLLRAARFSHKRNLMDESHRVSILISTCIILFVELISIAIISFFMLRNMNRDASTTADEIQVVFVEPLYNVDDLQTMRIGEALLSSNRFAGITITSTATGRVLEKAPSYISRWIPPQTREIEYNGIPLGLVVLYFSDYEFREIVRNVFLIMFCVIAAVLAANVFAHRFFSQKRIRGILDRITSGINEIAAGNYERRVENSGYADMDAIIRLMNDMSLKVQSKNAELLTANNRLEQRVAERTSELEIALAEQRLLQDRLIESGKLTALGQLSAGIAHELNTPLGAIVSSNRLLAATFDEKVSSTLTYYVTLDPIERSLFDAIIRVGFLSNRTLTAALPGSRIAREILRQLQDAHIPDSGELAAPLMDLGLADCIPELIPFLATKRNLEIISQAGDIVIARRMVEIIHESSQRATNVVSAFRSYVSPEREESKLVDIPRDISQVLTLMHNMLKHGIKVQTNFIPVMVRGSSDKLSQVWMNLIRNGAQAMEFNGVLEIRTEMHGESAVVSVTDNGPGIPADIQDKIFEPFFTTKKQGEGMGLGLDICKRIVEMHHGRISFESRPGRTEFFVVLPSAAS